MKVITLTILFFTGAALAQITPNPIMPAVRQAAWEGNVGVPGGIPYYPVGVNVTNYGAMGNGVHDDAAAIQEAISHCSNGYAVYFPAGTYLVSTNIIVPAGYPPSYPSIVLRGDGPGLTTIELETNGPEDVIKFHAGTSTNDPIDITNGLSQNSTKLGLSSMVDLTVGSIISITELGGVNFFL